MTLRTRTASHFAAMIAIAAMIVAIGSPAAADPPVVVAQVNTADYSVELTTSGDGSIEADIHNKTAATISFGLGATLHEVNTIEPVWTVAWGQLAEFARADVAAGDTYQASIPSWSGMGISVMRDLDTTPASVLDYRIPGRWFGLDVQSVSATAFSLQFGSRVTVSPALGRPGESLYVQATGLDLPSAEVWISSADALDIKTESTWDFDVESARSLGLVSVSGGTVAAWVPFPSDLAPGDYSVVIGEPGGAFVPAGPLLTLDEGENAVNVLYNVQLEAGAPRNVVPNTGGPVSPVDQNGAQPVTLTFPSGPNSATVTTSTTGPAPTGFSALTGSSPAYYELTSATPPTGPVMVCITFDTTGMTAGDAASQHLYHYVSGAWVDITTTSSTGEVCGTTSSFSPFAIGKPLPAPPTTWPFTGFLDPISSTKVNTELAGTIIPVRFKLGGDRGLTILANGSPASGVSACTQGGNAATKTKTTALVASQPLQYVKGSQTYWYLWKTSSSWAGTCRQFVMTLTDGTVHTATIKFLKVGLFDILRAIIKIF